MQNYSSHQTHSTAKNYEVVAELGHGAQGSVYLVREEETQCEYAAKVYDKSDRLSLEERILRKLRGHEGFPQIVDTTEIDEQNVVIMQLLGDNLRTLKDRQKESRFSLSTALQILYQLISRLEVLHKKGYVHCDIKPDNMLIAAAKDNENRRFAKGDPAFDSNVYLVDFGLAHSYLDRNGIHIRQPPKVSFKGTISYCSLNLLDKQYPSRRDDLESLIYVVLFLYYGQLPWHQKAQTLQGRERLDYVIRMKQDLHITYYGPDIPESILKCYEHVRELDYTDEPDYLQMKTWVAEDLKMLINSTRGSALQVQIGMYDWTPKRSLEQQQKGSSPVVIRGITEMLVQKKTSPNYQSVGLLPLASALAGGNWTANDAHEINKIPSVGIPPIEGTRHFFAGPQQMVSAIENNGGASQQQQQHGANATSPHDHSAQNMQQSAKQVQYVQKHSQARISGAIMMKHHKMAAEDHNESQSMEAEYQDFMSIELDEGLVDFNMQGLETRVNQLSSLSPCSPNSMKDSEEGGSCIDFRRVKLAATVGGGQQGQDFKQQLKICLMPFDFAEDGEFDVANMQSEIEGAKTQRKQSSFGPSSLKTMEQIKRDRKFSMQQPIISSDSPIQY